MLIFLLQELNKNKTITIEDLLYLLKNKYPDVDLNKSHISRIIKDNNITLKIRPNYLSRSKNLSGSLDELPKPKFTCLEIGKPC